MYWKVFVSSEFGEGLIVADTKNGSTSDLNLIMANEFTEGFKNEGKDIIHRNLYSQSNGEEIDGVVCGVYYGNVYNKRRITAITPNSIVRLNPLDISLWTGTAMLSLSRWKKSLRPIFAMAILPNTW